MRLFILEVPICRAHVRFGTEVFAECVGVSAGLGELAGHGQLLVALLLPLGGHLHSKRYVNLNIFIEEKNLTDFQRYYRDIFHKQKSVSGCDQNLVAVLLPLGGHLHSKGYVKLNIFIGEKNFADFP